MKIVLVTGGFDPIHSGHISYFQAARNLGDKLIVGINSDEWLTRKKGQPFMTWIERCKIIKELKMVDFVIEYNDDDNSSKNAIKLVRQTFPNDTIVFANGGDRGDQNILEMDYEDNNLEFAFGVGGNNKQNSSSWILNEWKAPKTERPWGYYRVLYETPNTKVKELTVEPGKSLSMQRHEYRNEYWHVVDGIANVLINSEKVITIPKNGNLNIDKGDWHQLRNENDEPLKIVEIQFGDKCIEDDIERKL
jgi:cytidyltransferase-like protein